MYPNKHSFIFFSNHKSKESQMQGCQNSIGHEIEKQNTKCIVRPPYHVVMNPFALYFSLILSNIARM